MNACEHIKPLLMGLIDGELTSDQVADVTRHLNRCRACREELADLRDACDPLKHLTYEEPGRKTTEALWKTPFSRFTRYAGLLTVLAGWILLMAFAAIDIARDNSTETGVKIALAAMALGTLILLANVLIYRIVTCRQDPYKEVDL